MKTLLSLLALVLMFAAGAVAGPKVGGPWPLHAPASTPGKLKAGSAVTGAGLQIDWNRACFFPDGRAVFEVSYGTSATPLRASFIGVDAACTKAIRDLDGATVYTTTGGADPLCTTASGVVTRVNAFMSSCASGGKCNIP